MAEPAEACSDDYEEYKAPGFGATGTVRVPNYEYQRKLPERSEPDRDHRRRARRRPPLRPQVRHPDRGHGHEAGPCPDRRLAQEAQRDPRGPRRRHPPAQLHGPVLRLQQHLRARDERLPDGEHRLALEPRVRLPLVHLGQRPLPQADRVRLRRLRHLSRVRPRGPLQALRHRGRPRELLREHDRLVGHRRERHLHPRLEVPRQLGRA